MFTSAVLQLSLISSREWSSLLSRAILLKEEALRPFSYFAQEMSDYRCFSSKLASLTSESHVNGKLKAQ
jgi:hypothetical protein